MTTRISAESSLTLIGAILIVATACALVAIVEWWVT